MASPISVGVMMQRDEPEQRPRKQVDTRAVNRLRKAENENSEEHEREPRRAKITYTTIHHDLETRVTDERVLRVLSTLKGALPRMEWLVFIALNFGTVEDDRGVLRFHVACQEIKQRLPSIDEIARYYHLSYSTVQNYDSRARRLYIEVDENTAVLPGKQLEERRNINCQDA